MPRRVYVDLTDEALVELMQQPRWSRLAWPLSRDLSHVATKRNEAIRVTRLVFEHPGLPDVEDEDGRPVLMHWILKQD